MTAVPYGNLLSSIEVQTRIVSLQGNIEMQKKKNRIEALELVAQRGSIPGRLDGALSNLL